MRTYGIMLFIICLNMSAFLLYNSGVLEVSRQPYYAPSNLLATFSISGISAVMVGLGVTAGVSGLLAFFTRQYALTGAALLIYAVGVIIPVVSDVFLDGVPKMLEMLNAPDYITLAVRAILAFVFFMFIFEVISQRQVST